MDASTLAVKGTPCASQYGSFVTTFGGHLNEL
jgi:hypothetical protein